MTSRAQVKIMIMGLIGGLAILGWAGSAGAETAPLIISGFGDFYYVAHEGNKILDRFSLGQAEVDLEMGLEHKIILGLALAYDSEEETFGLGAFTVDFHLLGSEEDNFMRMDGLKRAGLIAGRFDVPFGIDWRANSSLDRKLVTVPLVVEKTHDQWNDQGVQLYLTASWVDVIVYMVNGFGYDRDETGGDGEPLDKPMEEACGGRLGLKPFSWLELGGSYAAFIDHDEKRDMELIGADLAADYENLSFKGEYIRHRLSLAEKALRREHDGYYLEGRYHFDPLFLVARYDSFSPDKKSEEKDLASISSGVGWIILENCELRFEYQAGTKKVDDAAYLQLAVGF